MTLIHHRDPLATWLSMLQGGGGGGDGGSGISKAIHAIMASKTSCYLLLVACINAESISMSLSKKACNMRSLNLLVCHGNRPLFSMVHSLYMLSLRFALVLK